jgi:hypothetical protein
VEAARSVVLADASAAGAPTSDREAES